MPSIDEASGAVGGNAEAARELSGAVAGSKETIGQLASALAGLGVEAKAAEANGAAEDAEQLAGQANALADALDALRARIESLRGLVTSNSGGGTTPLAVGGGSAPAAPVPRRRLAGFDAKRLHKDAISEVRRVGYPKNAEGRTSARGFVYTAEGDQTNAEPLRPYPKGQGPVRKELREPWASSDNMSTTWHVEGDAAATIRGEGLDGAAFYLNVPLCGKRAADSELADPKGCYENFRHIIPAGTTAWVHVVPERGEPFRVRIKGTGEGIE